MAFFLELSRPNFETKVALFFSLSLPAFFPKFFEEIGGVYKHIGIYGYRRNSLFQFSMLKSTEREKSRSLEQLRLLDNGMKISAMISNCEQWAVDTKEDLEKVKQMMAATKTTIDEES